MDLSALRMARMRRSNSCCPPTNLPLVGSPARSSDTNSELMSPILTIKLGFDRLQQPKHPSYVDTSDQYESEKENQETHDDTETDNSDSRPATPEPSRRRKVTILQTKPNFHHPHRRRRNSADARSSVAGLVHPGSVPAHPQQRTQYFLSDNTTTIASTNNNSAQTLSKLSVAQKQGCFQYMKRRHSVAMAFATAAVQAASNSNNNQSTEHKQDKKTKKKNQKNQSQNQSNNNNCCSSSGDAHPNQEQDQDPAASADTHWEFVKAKHGIQVFKSRRSRCEIRGVARVNASVKNVMALLAAGESTESFCHAQQILLGKDQVLEARVLASCVPSSASRFFHCGLKYMAMKNPFGGTPLDLVFLDYTDVTKTKDDNKLMGYRMIESIRVPEFRTTTTTSGSSSSAKKWIRGSIRCEVYVVKETNVPGVVEVTFASHLDPKSKYSAAKRHAWLDQTVVRLGNVRGYAESASFAHRRLLEKPYFVERGSKQACFVCENGFSFFKKRHNCRLCGQVTCGRCSRKLPIFVGSDTARVRVCVGCMIESRHRPDEWGQNVLANDPTRRNSIGNSTWIAYDEIEDVCDEDDGEGEDV